jgi:hypothetical protein
VDQAISDLIVQTLVQSLFGETRKLLGGKGPEPIANCTTNLETCQCVDAANNKNSGSERLPPFTALLRRLKVVAGYGD